MAWFTRSDNGWIRQAAVRELFGQPREWLVSHLVQLLGKYVIEICSDIADLVEATVTTDAGWTQAFIRLWADNPGFVTPDPWPRRALLERVLPVAAGLRRLPLGSRTAGARRTDLSIPARSGHARSCRRVWVFCGEGGHRAA